MSKRDELIVSVLTLFLAVPVIIFHGLVIALYWEWFVIPTFSVDPISIPAALGLSSLIHYATYQPTWVKEDNDDGKLILRKLVTMTTRPLWALAFGWIYTLFM